MGRFNNGILGGFLGKIGTVIGGKWKGIDYMRSRGPSRRNNSTQPQIQQQAKFALAMSFVRRMSSLFKITYRNTAYQMTARNSALSYIITNAITGVYPDFTIDYAQVLVSRGSLDNVDNVAVTATAGALNYTWVAHEGVSGLDNKDRSILVVYCPARRQCMYKLYAGTRGDAAASMDVKPFIGQEVVTWLAFISEDGTQLSDSLYTGKLVIS